MTFKYLIPGTTIRYLAGPLGIVGDADAEVAEGDLGRVLGPLLDEGWFATEPARYPGKVCPVSRDLIEAAR